MSVQEFAPAKLNLTLHVTGQREDGYHLLDSLVVFARVGDSVTLVEGGLSLSVSGPFAQGLSGDDNLCLRAARLAGAEAAISLTKNLPVASGIGGGSADAAAVLRGLARMGHELPPEPERLGADLPVCLASQPARMRGTGEILQPVPDLPDLRMVLVNPRIEVPTPAVFRALEQKNNPAMPDLPGQFDLEGLLDYLHACRNDLQDPAINLFPVIGTVLRALQDEGAMLARMSGSGATCFGIFPDATSAGMAAYRIGAAYENWWITSTGLAPQSPPI
ncbi:4-(cytidine 5'-diphospho)-2-C-methyl-D-erythritol kinase [Paracoccus aerodenitrificans]|uniref:4-(cytidine 5'-diphospho)-2-C-methyl-D-erythritol kinase n=1 Tax=Paracoccus aerodenitrificans TaxID=3017781 RepID=UPI0022F090F2|nr:4-(cytidine 5'-diphospho)-2-C-methyl-D-erythritol kinase [Paracoccus aerodenitrificans]WBU64017.1 4-(cytidine 5'-diphospho)-2-C-methyl-D-erythritol kinase [Paracoccus aerodenitrificans]